MTTTSHILPAIDSVTQSSKISLTHRWARRAVQRHLARVTEGQLTAHDSLGEWRVGHSGPECTLIVHDMGFYSDLILDGGLGAARSYMNAKWSSPNLTSLFRFFVTNIDTTDGLDSSIARLGSLIPKIKHQVRRNTPGGSRRNIHKHYDLGNELFELFLDESMTYSAGIFESKQSSMGQASIAKLDRICRKLRLGPDDHILEIGSGWGSFAIHAAGQYGCRVTTTTISKQQFDLASERIARAGLADRVELLLRDYRDLEGKFDKLISIEMIEAVGHKFLPYYFKKCAELLRQDGQMLLQAITMPDRRYEQYLRTTDFIQTYIFPGSCCPSLSAMLGAMKSTSDFSLVHLEEIGQHYAKTLRHWRRKFKENESRVLQLGYPQRFVRMWEYYLCYCEAGFAERYIGDVQMLLNKPSCRTAPLIAPLPMH